MSGKSRSEEGIALIASCPYVKSVTEKAARHESSFMQILIDQLGRPRARALTQAEIIARQQAKIEMLQQENDFFCQMRRLERRHQPSKSPSKKGLR